MTSAPRTSSLGAAVLDGAAGLSGVLSGWSSEEIGVWVREGENIKRLIVHGKISLHGAGEDGGLGLTVSTGDGFPDRERCLHETGDPDGPGGVVLDGAVAL